MEPAGQRTYDRYGQSYTTEAFGGDRSIPEGAQQNLQRETYRGVSERAAVLSNELLRMHNQIRALDALKQGPFQGIPFNQRAYDDLLTRYQESNAIYNQQLAPQIQWMQQQGWNR